MFLKILNNISKKQEETKKSQGVALAALFIQLAKVDNDFSDEEYQLISGIIEKRYGVTKSESETIIKEAEIIETDSSDTMQITREVKSVIPYEDRLEILRDLWKIIMADNHRTNEENNFMRLVTKLLGMSDKLSGQIRKEVERSSAHK